MDIKFYWVFITALIPLLVGMVWYNKAVFGKAWMAASGMTEEKGKNMNMILIFVLVYIFGALASMAMMPVVIHQMGIFSVFAEDKSPEGTAFVKGFMDSYGTRFRTFKHGAFHGVLTAVLFVLPIVGISALFEARGWKYIMINFGYWAVSLALIGGVLCQLM